MEFKEFCKNKIKEKQLEAKKIEDKIASFPDTNDIDLNSFGGIKEISKEYQAFKKNSKRISLFFRPSILELKKYIRNRELKKLKHLLETIRNEINELSAASDSLSYGTFIKSVIPNNLTIMCLLEYSDREKIEADQALELLLSLLRQNKDNTETVLDQLKHDIIVHFDKSNQLIEGTDSKTIEFLFDKLISLIKKENDKYDYSIIISSIKNIIRMQAETTLRSKKYDLLQHEQEKIRELQQYIKEGQIIMSSPSLEYFKSLLQSVSIPADLANNYIEQMEQLISKEEKESDFTIVSKYLTDTEKKVFEEGYTLLLEIKEEDLNILLKRCLKNIVSICKYIEMVHQTPEEESAYEVLSAKLDQLKTCVSNIKRGSTANHVFNYLTDQENVPTILREIESMDIVLYNEAESLLSELAEDKNKGKSIGTQNGIDLYKLNGSYLSLVYSKDNSNNLVIIGLDTSSNLLDSNYKRNITPAQREEIARIYRECSSKVFNQTQAIYEQIIAKTLDVQSINYANRLEYLKKI